MDYSNNFILLVIIYSMLVVTIHMMYEILAKSARNWLTTPKSVKL